MGVVAKMLTDEDIANVSAWYASIKITVTDPE
jgi:cytochrome c553